MLQSRCLPLPPEPHHQWLNKHPSSPYFQVATTRCGSYTVSQSFPVETNLSCPQWESAHSYLLHGFPSFPTTLLVFSWSTTPPFPPQNICTWIHVSGLRIHPKTKDVSVAGTKTYRAMSWTYLGSINACKGADGLEVQQEMRLEWLGSWCEAPKFWMN